MIKSSPFQFLDQIGVRALRIQLGSVLETAVSSPDAQALRRRIVERCGHKRSRVLSICLTCCEKRPPTGTVLRAMIRLRLQGGKLNLENFDEGAGLPTGAGIDVTFRQLLALADGQPDFGAAVTHGGSVRRERKRLSVTDAVVRRRYLTMHQTIRSSARDANIRRFEFLAGNVADRTLECGALCVAASGRDARRPHWRPALLAGRAVNHSVVLPIRVVLGMAVAQALALLSWRAKIEAPRDWRAMSSDALLGELATSVLKTGRQGGKTGQSRSKRTYCEHRTNSVR